jgi:hypothetical protein
MWKLGLRPRNSFYGNTQIQISLQLTKYPQQFDDILRIILHRWMSCGYSSTPSGSCTEPTGDKREAESEDGVSINIQVN